MQQTRENHKKQINLLQEELKKQIQEEMQTFEKHFSLNTSFLKHNYETRYRNKLEKSFKKRVRKTRTNIINKTFTKRRLFI